MRQFDQELRDLRDGLLSMAGLAEEMIDLTIQALTERSRTKAEQVMAMDRGLDEWELKLDRLCIDLLALRSPAAGDLRLIASSLKIVPELERIGDHCCNIARRATYVHPPILSSGSLERLGQETRGMVRMAVDAFIGSDAGLARTVIKSDDSVDELYGQIYRELLRRMMSDPLSIERASHLILVIKNWERIADQATNIAEEVLFILEGRSAKHPYLQGDSVE
ncbi:phosphate transport system regulatory protein PhoU [Geothrix limicola]|uniref:Phosphate-specific transport system accessory protein PhoU n=1 Tax=Geothrix limicola TaxID=2927978 RepID=A0ABQ5QDE5_9BACT|nr:phosphate signaling complex protein PhoU [Geothrix limicola]GLH72356.1 phosphate transport system regulatory protein PhoU [Geothrix limicola]